jgi:hypothetical protein
MVVLAGRAETGAQLVVVEMASVVELAATVLPALAPIWAPEEMGAWVAMLDQVASAETAERAEWAETAGTLT